MADQEVQSMVGTVDDVESGKTTKGSDYWKFTIAGERLNLFDAKLKDNARKGDQVEVFYTQSGNYRNITAINPLEEKVIDEDYIEEETISGEPDPEEEPEVIDIKDPEPPKEDPAPDPKKEEPKPEPKEEPKKEAPKPTPVKKAAAPTIQKGEVPDQLDAIKNADAGENYFLKLAKIEAPLEKKGPYKLNYISWADAWALLKKEYPQANYDIFLTSDETPLFKAGNGGMVKVSVTVNECTHIVMLPVMDNKNVGIKYEQIDSFTLNKSIQRALAKAIAMHGMGLYVYRGEDLPEDE